MTITFDFGSFEVTLDETAGLQGTDADPVGKDEDNNDDDVLLSTLPDGFATILTGLGVDLTGGSFADTIGVATGQIATVTSDSLPITGITFDIDEADRWSGLRDLDGNKLFYYADTEENIVLLRRGSGDTPDSGGDIVAALYLVEDADGMDLSEDVSVWVVQLEALQNTSTASDDDALWLINLDLNVSSSIEFDFAGVPSGQNYFAAFGTTSAALLVTGLDPVLDTDSQNFNQGDTLNSSQGGGITTLGSNNQMINPGQGLIFTFVSGQPDGLLVNGADPLDQMIRS